MSQQIVVFFPKQFDHCIKCIVYAVTIIICLYVAVHQYQYMVFATIMYMFIVIPKGYFKEEQYQRIA